MKHGIAMYLAVMLRVKKEEIRLPRDLVFLATVDEVTNTENGARFLVEEHPGLFEGIQTYGFTPLLIS